MIFAAQKRMAGKKMRFIFIIILITAVTLIAGEKESEESALADQQNPVSFNNDKFNLIQMANDKLDDEMTETHAFQKIWYKGGIAFRPYPRRR